MRGAVELASVLLRAGALAVALIAPPATAATISGVSLQPTQTFSGTELQLAGCGTREMFFMNIYVVSLYLPQKDMPTARIMAPDTAKLVQLNVTYDGSVPNNLPDSWRSRIEDEIRRELMQTLQNVYASLETGDTVTIAYAPDAGTTVMANGRTVATRPGHDPIHAMLQMWIGQNPVSGNLKRLLLGSCGGADQDEGGILGGVFD